MILISLFVIIISQLVLLFIYYRRSVKYHQYWKNRNVPFVKPVPFVGNILDVCLFKKQFSVNIKSFYDNIATPVFGIYIFNNPHIVIKSPEVIKSILINDFNHFQNRTMPVYKEYDSLQPYFLFSMKNQEWKVSRQKFSALFTSFKLKNMFGLMREVADDLRKYLKKTEGEIEVKEVSGKFTTNVISTCAFGINGRCFENEEGVFQKVATKVFGQEYRIAIQQICYFFFPQLVKLFKMPFFDKETATFLTDLFSTTIEERERNNYTRNDLIDLMIKAKNSGDLLDGIKFEVPRAVGHAAEFFAAGLESSSNTISYALYELTINQNVQKRLREEIKPHFSEKGSITFDNIQSMKYMHMVVSETLRKYPTLPFLDRVCTRDYSIPGSDVIIEKGISVIIPLLALQNDPEYYPEPEKFDPERFSEENVDLIPPFTYLPFGGGPRNCLGSRFAKISIKLSLITILSEYELVKGDGLDDALEFNPVTFLLRAKNGVRIRLELNSILK